MKLLTHPSEIEVFTSLSKMIPQKKKAPLKKATRKKASKKKGPVIRSIVRLCSFLVLLLVLVFSVCTVGYVIFFRTVFSA
jgi:hypothetical protein